jgi:hypothetical protein
MGWGNSGCRESRVEKCLRKRELTGCRDVILISPTLAEDQKSLRSKTDRASGLSDVEDQNTEAEESLMNETPVTSISSQAVTFKTFETPVIK